MQENRSFDHYLGRLTQYGHPVDGFPATYTNPTTAGGIVKPAHATTTCISPDLPHNFTAIHNEWNNGEMNGFYRVADRSGDGARALAWYDQTDVPFYYWLYSTFAMSDRFFCAALGPDLAEPRLLYAATSDGVTNTFERKINVPTIYDALDKAAREVGRLRRQRPAPGLHRLDATTPGFHATAEFFAALTAGTLPAVTFVDGEAPAGRAPARRPAERRSVRAQDDRRRGVRQPAVGAMAILLTYDEARRVLRPRAAAQRRASPRRPQANATFTSSAPRVPLVVISPWARRGYVSHVRKSTRRSRASSRRCSICRRSPRATPTATRCSTCSTSARRRRHAAARRPTGTGGCKKRRSCAATGVSLRTHFTTY